MTVSLSPHKISRIFRLFFSGMPQPDIAEKAGVDQSTVSLYASRFRNTVGKVGLLTAGKEFGVFNEVDSLRSLSVELTKADLTVEDCRKGMNMIKAFLKLGINPEQHTALVNVCKHVDDPGFVQAALKLSKMEADNNISYEEAIAKFKKAASGLPPAQKQLKMKQTEIKSVEQALAQKKAALASAEGYLTQLQNTARDKKANLEQELSTKIKQSKVRQEEIEEISKLKGQLAKQGLDLSTLIKLAKEFSDGNGRG
jgi:DNA repair exonuclease SbcCD ATPase subunit